MLHLAGWDPDYEHQNADYDVVFANGAMSWGAYGLGQIGSTPCLMGEVVDPISEC